MELRSATSKNRKPMKPMATVSPENRIARPDVAMVRDRASGTGRRPTSSRKRLTTKSE
jgi:hypothetical protein